MKHLDACAIHTKYHIHTTFLLSSCSSRRRGDKCQRRATTSHRRSCPVLSYIVVQMGTFPSRSCGSCFCFWRLTYWFTRWFWRSLCLKPSSSSHADKLEQKNLNTQAISKPVNSSFTLRSFMSLLPTFNLRASIKLLAPLNFFVCNPPATDDNTTSHYNAQNS